VAWVEVVGRHETLKIVVAGFSQIDKIVVLFIIRVPASDLTMATKKKGDNQEGGDCLKGVEVSIFGLDPKNSTLLKKAITANGGTVRYVPSKTVSSPPPYIRGDLTGCADTICGYNKRIFE